MSQLFDDRVTYRVGHTRRVPFALVGPGHPAYPLLERMFPGLSPGAALAVAMDTFQRARRDRKRLAFLARRLKRRRKASR